jgi:hypothetical protein
MLFNNDVIIVKWSVTFEARKLNWMLVAIVWKQKMRAKEKVQFT